jgi:poly(hydroxyalkanoate) depolymerase family esterase
VLGRAARATEDGSVCPRGVLAMQCSQCSARNAVLAMQWSQCSGRNAVVAMEVEMRNPGTTALVGIATALLACAPQLAWAPAVRAQLTPVAAFGENPAGLTMYLHAPEPTPAGPRPLVVALHGCTQTASGYEAAGWSDLADELGFYVVYPEQNRTDNNSLGCFNWGGGWAGMPNAFVGSSTPVRVDDIRRGGPEVTSLIAMVDHVRSTYAIDGGRIFVSGLSAGGGMTSVLLATHPDVFAGGAVMAGIPYGCATDRATTGEASACLGAPTGANAYLDRDPSAWAQLVREGHPGYDGPWPRVSIWHGTSDFIVHQAWAGESVEQWVAIHGADATPDAMEEIDGAMRATYLDGSGTAIVERWSIAGMGHGTAIDGSGGCGRTGSYVLDVGVCSTRRAAEFFGLTSSVAPSGDAGPVRPGTDGGSATARDAGRGAWSDAGALAGCDSPPDASPALGCQASAGVAHRAVAVALVALAWIFRMRRARS